MIYGFEICNSFTGESYGFCSKAERYTTPLAKQYPLIFKPAIKTDNKWHTINEQEGK